MFAILLLRRSGNGYTQSNRLDDLGEKVNDLTLGRVAKGNGPTLRYSRKCPRARDKQKLHS